MATEFTVDDALARQAASCANSGSPLYGELLDGLLADHRSGGITATMLDGVSDVPVHDALPLRYLAAGHRLALRGDGPALAAYFPSCGGSWTPGAPVTAAFLTTVAENEDEFRRGMRENVQTNEIGRAAVLASGFSLIARRHDLPLAQLEIGSSAGLLSRWDRYHYDSGHGTLGDPSSPVQFGPQWWEPDPPQLTEVEITRRAGSDISPMDASTPAGANRMLGFVWPDQLDRVERLRGALAIAAEAPFEIDRADAGDWLAGQLADGLRDGSATVVFHSIVWQYLPRPTKDAVKAALAAAGEQATPPRPLCWLRMEPLNAEHAAVHLTTWRGAGPHVELLAEVGYHGAGVRWLAG